MGMEFVSSVMLDSNWVEGWGTLITPNGSFDALRVRNKHIDRVPNTPIVEVGTSIDFVTVDDQIGASIVVEDGRAFHAIRTVADIPSSVNELPAFNFYFGPSYPNPTFGVTQIPFILDRAETVGIHILQQDGKLVKTLGNQRYLSGSHEVSLDLSGLASGTYLLEMRVGQQRQQRFLVVR